MEIKDKRLPSLDGWRALSIFLVLAAHTKETYDFPKSLDIYFKWLFDGDLGVRTFFLISGMLITWLLLNEEHSTGSISLKNFYIRRVLRIWPVYFTYLFVLLVLQIFTAYSQTGVMWLGNVLFMTNFFGAKWTNGHLWSLAVEEQFYFLWPVLMVVVKNKKVLIKLLFLTFVLAPICRVITYLQPQAVPWKIIFTGYSFFNYWDSLAVGCLSSILVSINQKKVIYWVNKAKFYAPLLVLVPYILVKLFLLGPFTVSVGPLLQAIGICILVVYSVFEKEAFLHKILNTRLLVKIGVLSYSLYIWQMIFCSKPEYFGFSGNILFSWKSWLLPVLLVASCSYYFLEKPFIGLRRYFHKKS